jgi:hypothetical protein
MTDFTIPEHFHVLDVGTIVWIDHDTRLEIEAFLRGNPQPTDFILVDSLVGEEVTVIAGAVNTIWSSSAPIRAHSRSFTKQMNEEIPVEDRE